jgi:hypothetical protein
MPVLIAPALVGGLGMSAAGAQLVSGIIFTVGSTLLSQLLMPGPDVPDGKIPFKQPIPPRGYGGGRSRVYGSVMLHEAAGGNGGKLLIVQALVSHPCSAFVQYFLHEDEVEFYDGAKVEKVDGGKGYHDKVFLYTRLGAVPETAIAEITGAQITDSPWTSDHRGDGITYLALRCDDADEDSQPKKFPFGKPVASAVLDLALMFDPRQPGHDVEDDATWEWSDNPVINILWLQCHCEWGYQRDYATAILPYVETWKAAADACDVAEALDGGGAEKRYRCGWNETTKTDPRAVLAQLLASCDGWIVDRGDGGIDIRVGTFEEPEIVVTDDDIVGFDIAYGIPDEEVVNRLAVTFTNPDDKYTETEVDPFEDAADQTARGTVREHRFPLNYVQSPTQARRLGKREFARLTEPLRGTLDLRLDVLDACYARWIRVQSATIPQLADRVIENRKGHLSLLAGSVRLAFLGSGSSIDDWTPATDEGTLPATPVGPPEQGFPILQNLTIDYVQFTNADGGIVRALRAVFDEPATVQHYVMRWTWTEDTPDGMVVRSESETFTAAAASGGAITLLTSVAIPEVAALGVQVAVKSVSGPTLGDYQPDPAVVLDTRTVTTTTADGTELREDGSAELREDGSLELRETT